MKRIDVSILIKNPYILALREPKDKGAHTLHRLAELRGRHSDVYLSKCHVRLPSENNDDTPRIALATARADFAKLTVSLCNLVNGTNLGTTNKFSTTNWPPSVNSDIEPMVLCMK